MAIPKQVRKSYLVEGMTCTACERTVERVLEMIDGVASAKAELKSSTVSIEYDSSKATIDDIRAAIKKVGYKFVGERPPHGQREGSDEAVA